jgi:hypothetical protein
MSLKISLFGGAGIVRQFRELLKDLRFRNEQEKRKGELEIERLEHEVKASKNTRNDSE